MNRKLNKKPIPLWEVSLTLISFYVAALLFLYPDLLDRTSHLLYMRMKVIATQIIWAFLFVATGTMLGAGLLLNDKTIRVLGLVMAALLFGVIAICYMFDFPNLPAGLFTIITLMTVMTIFYVNVTEL